MTLWQVPIIDGALPVVLYALAAVLAAVLLVRRWHGAAIATALLGAFAGVLAAIVAFAVVNTTESFGDPLPGFVLSWLMLGFGACGFAIAGFVGTRIWRKAVSAIAIVVFLAAATIGMNAQFGINPNLGTLFGLPAAPLIDLPASSTTSTEAPAQSLFASWTPPADMPAQGRRGTVTILGTVSGFDARPAGIYLPPAALVSDAPALPLVVMMMGHPGSPDPTAISDVLDAFAARNGGLAPIVVVADQVGAAIADTACADSATYGKARTYMTQDVVAWARKNLHVIDDPAYWTIAGYSNGGGCAVTFGAQSPQLWKNILDVSGEPFGGSEQVANITRAIYGGSAAAFEASKPVNILAAAAPGTYAGVTAVFTAGAADPAYIAAADSVANAAQRAGMTVTRYDIPSVGHTGAALKLGLIEGFTVLYPVLGLSAG